jgi:transposase
VCHKNGSYPNDLTDEQWAIIEPLLPTEKWGRPIEIEMRSAVKGTIVAKVPRKPKCSLASLTG